MSHQLFTPTMLLVAVLLPGCATEDPRVEVLPGLRPVTSGNGEAPPGGLGALCVEGRVECDRGLSCYSGTCTPTEYVEACTPNPCGETGVCNARGEVTEEGMILDGAITVICRCPAENEQWDGTTCRESPDEAGFPQFGGSTLPEGQTCPGPAVQIGVEGATDCPGETFCDAAAGGRCLQHHFTLVGELSGQPIAVSSVGREQTAVECIREYFALDEVEEDTEANRLAGQNHGVKLVVRGTLAEQIAPGQSSIVVRWWNGPVLEGSPLLVFPQMDAPSPRSDAVFGSLSLGSGETAAIGGQLTILSASGPDDDEDGRVDDNAGAVGGTFFLGLPDEQFVAGSFVAPCGPNETVPLPAP